MPVRGSLCLFWRETHTKSLRARFPMRPEEGEGRQGPRAVNRTRQSARERAINRSRGKRKTTARNCGPRRRVGQCERISQHSRWLCGNFARIQACDSPQMHRKLHKVSQISSFLCLELTQVRVCSLFFHSLGWVYCVLCICEEI